MERLGSDMALDLAALGVLLRLLLLLVETFDLGVRNWSSMSLPSVSSPFSSSGVGEPRSKLFASPMAVSSGRVLMFSGCSLVLVTSASSCSIMTVMLVKGIVQVARSAITGLSLLFFPLPFLVGVHETTLSQMKHAIVLANVSIRTNKARKHIGILFHIDVSGSFWFLYRGTFWFLYGRTRDW